MTLRTLLLAGLTCLSLPLSGADFHDWAPRPPLGWNSWDNFATTITEAQAKGQADYMDAHLKAHGWQYIVVDIQWYEPGAQSHAYRDNAVLTMDQWGRLLPAPNRFPSSKGGSGFTVLAKYMHDRGLKFGIHLMRGIPRQAVEKNLPVFNSQIHAADIADTRSTCPWNPDMYGVDMTKPGAQSYYDSVFSLIASWGVDYVKVDDLSRPYHQAEIEAIRAAIDKTGRPIVLSLSPGETPLVDAAHVTEHANLWRISDDFWDSWPTLVEQFHRLKNWNPHRKTGAWPDADMLPLGVIDQGRRKSYFTPEEQYTLMTLWSIARSPLMHGGDLTQTDPFTLSLLTNDEVLAVNQDSEGNRPLFERDNHFAWVANVPGSQDKYLAVFNARDQISQEVSQARYRSAKTDPGADRKAKAVTIDLQGMKKLVLVIDGAGDGTHNDRGVWGEPWLETTEGKKIRLTDSAWLSASGGWGQVAAFREKSEKPTTLGGEPVAFGISAIAQSVVEYALPEKVKSLTVRPGLADDIKAGSGGGTVEFRVFAAGSGGNLEKDGLPVDIDLGELGFKGEIGVRDLWAKKDLATVRGHFAPEVPWHGARLFRLTPKAD